MDTTDAETGKTNSMGAVPYFRRAQYAPLMQIDAYWNALRGTRMMPLRSEIDPRGLKGALEYCFVAERIAPGLARLRVAGSHLGDLMGMEVRGMPVSAFLMADSRSVFSDALEEACEGPATVAITMTAETSFGRPDLEARMTLMPVRSDLGDTSRILGGFVSSGDIGRVPRRFNITNVEISPIVGQEKPVQSTASRLIPDAFRSAEKTAPPVAATETPAEKQDRIFSRIRRQKPAVAAEEAAPFGHAVPGAPHLRVIK